MRRYLTTKTLILLLAGWTVFSTLAVFLIAIFFMGPNSRAVIFMGAGLVLFWIALGGSLMWRTRDGVRDFVTWMPLPRPFKFILL